MCRCEAGELGPHESLAARARGPGRYHSFPARRSSDLERSQAEAAFGPIESLDAYDAERAAIEARRVRTRSEEHTSELQSLRHLVCRLLPEKKKTSPVSCVSLEQPDGRGQGEPRGHVRW